MRVGDRRTQGTTRTVLQMVRILAIIVVMSVCGAARVDATVSAPIEEDESDLEKEGGGVGPEAAVRVIGEASRTPIPVHIGNDYNAQITSYTGQTVVWWASADGVFFVKDGDVVRISEYDADEVDAAEVGTVDAPTDCRDISSLVVDTGSESILFFLKSKTLFCSCEWTADAPCPSVLEVTSETLERQEDDEPLSTTTISSTTITELVVAGNTAVDLQSVTPDVVAPLSFSDPADACAPLQNAEAVNGTICVTQRGGCSFSSKYQNCADAGAVGAVVVNTVDEYTTMPASGIAEDFPFMFSTKSGGDTLRELASQEGASVVASAGANIVSTRPLPGFSDGPAMTAVGIGSSGGYPIDLVFDDADADKEVAFHFVEYAGYDATRELLFAICDTGKFHVLNVSAVVDGGADDGASRTYEELGSFENMMGSPPSLGIFHIFAHPEGSEDGSTPVLVGAAPDGSGPGFYDISDPLSPVLVSQLMLDTSFCPEAFLSATPGGFATIVGGGAYAYALPIYAGFSDGLSDICSGLEFDGVNYGNFPIAIYDIGDLDAPSLGTIVDSESPHLHARTHTFLSFHFRFSHTIVRPSARSFLVVPPDALHLQSDTFPWMQL